MEVVSGVQMTQFSPEPLAPSSNELGAPDDWRFFVVIETVSLYHAKHDKLHSASVAA